MAFEQTDKSGVWQVADRVGAMASFLCAVHCAALPFVLALLPFVGLSFLGDHRFERGFVVFACVLAAFALGRGFRRQQEPLPLLLAVPGIALLLFGVTPYMQDHSLVLHSTLVACGGMLLASAHFVNLRNGRRLLHAHVQGAQCAH